GAAVPLVGDWHAMLLTNPARGEAQATVDAFLVGRKEFESNTAYVAIGGFETGGKTRRPASEVCPTKNPIRVVTTATCWEPVASRVLAPRRETRPKVAPYESGIVPGREPPQRFGVRFYLVAMIFIVFDIEIIFLYPWAMAHTELGVFGLIAVVIFGASVFESF